MRIESTVQEQFLDALYEEQIPVSIYLLNGIKLQGKVAGFDENTILLENHAIAQLIYCHAISSIVPVKNPDYLTG